MMCACAEQAAGCVSLWVQVRWVNECAEGNRACVLYVGAVETCPRGTGDLPGMPTLKGLCSPI